jgi:hypothetical protein
MNVTQEQVFQKKQQLQQEIETYEKQLQQLAAERGTLTDIRKLAQSILHYNEIERQIEDRAHVFSLLSLAPESLLSPFIKAELFSYFAAAETIGPDMVNFLVDDVLMEVRAAIDAGEDDSTDLIQAEFREYVLPGKIIAQRFDELEPLLEEMNRQCKLLDPKYSSESARAVLRYAFEAALNADIHLDPLITAVRELPMKYLNEADRALLLDAIEQRLSSIRYELAKKENVAMERAVKLIEHREAEEDLEKTPFVDSEE